ncbi:MAG: hypothetical protein LBM13_03575, partial [Candidatus Ancillula sp.]|nr:hypothetical protein [Candidatus Ancillula sp.]
NGYESIPLSNLVSNKGLKATNIQYTSWANKRETESVGIDPSSGDMMLFELNPGSLYRIKFLSN